MAVIDRVEYVCQSCGAAQAAPIQKPLTKCQAYWKGRPCRGDLTQVFPKPTKSTK